MICRRIQSTSNAIGVEMIAQKMATNNTTLICDDGSMNLQCSASDTQAHLESPVEYEDRAASQDAVFLKLSHEPSSGFVRL